MPTAGSDYLNQFSRGDIIEIAYKGVRRRRFFYARTEQTLTVYADWLDEFELHETYPTDETKATKPLPVRAPEGDALWGTGVKI